MQHVDMDREVAAFLGAALVDHACHGLIGVEKRAAGHPLRQHLGHFDQPNGALDRDGANNTRPDVELVAGCPLGIADRRHPVTGDYRQRCSIQLVIFGGRDLMAEKGEIR